ncbi:MAG: ABC transporter transmembrane domain-containing protein [Nostocales cyanobacterium 94392]|nr:ABC transporter transmembrane domain-containing protein [Nostocales cyanobacterium 94392]
MDSYPELGVQKADFDINNTPFLIASSAIDKLWKQIVGDTNFTSEFKQAWICREFNLGDELTQYNCKQHSAVSGDVVYLVCQGKVRLLAFDTSLKKQVSIQLLNPSQIFGADNAFCDYFQEYRAVASSRGIIAQISLQDLDIWLQRYPTLYNYFSEASKSRQKLIFFKTLTELRSAKLPLSQNTATLQKLLAYFLNIKISAGSRLIASCSSEHRFWLVSGEIGSISGNKRLPVVGESLGYPHLIPEDLISLTDLSLFYLPQEHFDLVAEIVPELRSQKEAIKQEVKNQPEEKEYPVESEFEHVAEQEDDNCTEYIKFKNQHPPRRWFRSYPFIQQQSSSDCGVASLAMISQFWGKRFSLNTLRSIVRFNSMGAELGDLANAAESLGYQALAVRGAVSELESQNLPWIAHYQGNHYIVVWLIKDQRVLISDPAINKLWLSRWEFEANFTGYALLLFPTEQFYEHKSETISLTLSRLLQSFRDYRFVLTKIVIISILLPLLGIVPAILAQTVIDAIFSVKDFNSNFDSINIFALGFLLFGFGRIALTSIRRYLLDYLSNRLDLTLISNSISHTLNLPLSFFASRRVGDIISQIQENPKIHRFLTRQAISTILDGLMTVIYFGLMSYYSWQLTSVVVGFILLMMVLSAGTNVFLKNLQREYSFNFAAQNSAILEMITGIVTIKTSAAENCLRSRWEEHFTQTMEMRKKGQRITNSSQFATSLINNLGNTTVLWYGTQMVINAQISIGELIAFNMLMGNTINPMLALVKLWDEFLEVLVSVERLDDILASPDTENLQKPLIILPSIRGEVHFENVSFCQGQEQFQYSIHNMSFHVKPGQTIGIVGARDSGKSTLVKLLAGLYRPDSGRILIDGHDIQKVCPYSLRSQLGVVPQEFFLFTGSIEENITLYNREFSLEQVKNAAKSAGAQTFIEELPLGYNTIIGEAGIKLDRVQQLKIAVARALIKNPRILIVDEMSSSVDCAFEYQFQPNLTGFDVGFMNTASRFRTTFIVTPNLSSILNADTILVLDRGALAEQGTHEELMRNSIVYPKLVQHQLSI